MIKGRVALLSNQTGLQDWLEIINVTDNKVYKKPPHHCSECGSHKIVGLEVLGAHKDFLFWECAKCMNKHLRFTRSYTRTLLNKLSAITINIDDFIDIQDKEPN